MHKKCEKRQKHTTFDTMAGKTYKTPEELMLKLRSVNCIIQVAKICPFIIGKGKNETISHTAFNEVKKAGYLKNIGNERYIFQEIQLSIFDSLLP